MNKLGFEYIKYFDQYNKSRITNTKRLLILNGYSSYYLYEFEYYCKENNIVNMNDKRAVKTSERSTFSHCKPSFFN